MAKRKTRHDEKRQSRHLEVNSEGSKSKKHCIGVEKPMTRGNVKVVEFKEDGWASSLHETSEKTVGKSTFSGNAVGALNDRQEKRLLRKNINEAWDSVVKVGASGQNKQKRKKYEEDRLAELGFAKPEKPKIPMRVLYSMKKTYTARDKKHAADLKASGVVLGKVSKKKERTRKRPDDIHKWRGGNFHAGILQIKKR